MYARKKPKHDLDTVRLKHSIVYSWESFPARKKESVPLGLALLFQALGYCELLADSVVKFRKKFGLPEEGLPFKKYKKLICRAEPGPIYKFDTIPEMQGEKYEHAKEFLNNFVKENIVADPLSIQIPFKQDYITGTLDRYRSPVAIFLILQPSQKHVYIN